MPAASKLRQATLCFLIKGSQLLLAMEKRGFGEGKWNGYGGKLAAGETIEAAALREMAEEIGVRAAAQNLEKAATLRFYFKNHQAWNQQVHVYIVRQWSGEPAESEEMRPRWFAFEDIPYGEMWVDDKLWLPQVLQGKRVEAEFYFNNDASACEKFEVRELV